MLKPGLFITISATLLCPVLFFAYGADLVDINTASLEQLDTLAGIGPKLGQKIIDNRPYVSVDDLLRVQGIGPKNLEKIKQQGIATTTSTESTTTQQESVSIRADLRSAESSGKASRQTLTQNNSQGIVPNNIFLSEVLPSPEGPDTENEFIEIFNANNFEIDLSDWKIKDRTGAVKSYSLPENTKINANGFLVLKSSQTKISLNNPGDGVELLNPSGKIVDSTDFGKSQSGQSWSKISGSWSAQSPAGNEAGWQWTAKPTPNQANIILAPTSINLAQTASSSLQKTNNFTANIQNYPPQRKNLLAVAIAIAIALASAFIAWQIKKKSQEI